MRRFGIWCIAVLVSLPLLAQGNWYAPYQSAMTAIEKQNWTVAASELTKAIAVEFSENNAALHRGRKVEYLPHYWLGVARIELGDSDGALAAWKISEAQGKIQKTSRYADLRRRLSAVESERRQAEGAATSSVRDEADRALQDALSAQMAAVGARADRHADFRKGQQRLEDAWEVVNDSGSNAGDIERARKMANEAQALFEKATRAKQTQPPTAPPVGTGVDDSKTARPKEVISDPVKELVDEIAGGVEIPSPPELEDAEEERSGDVSEPTPVDQADQGGDRTRVDQQELIESEIESARSDGDLIRRAWEHFAKGNVNAAEALLSALIDTGRGSAESYLLRGCAVYTRAMMRGEESLMDRVRGDFIEALRRNPALRIEAVHFSPRLVEYFNTVRDEVVGRS